MAIKEFNPAMMPKKKFKVRIVHILIALVVVAVFSLGLFGMILPNYASIKQYREQTAQLEAEIVALDAESDEIIASLGNQSVLFEKIAREEYGYCKPGEKVFYNSSFGE